MEATKNVLVCEDDPVQLKILTTLINQAGYRSLAARTPGEAVVAARRCDVDAVLADVQLQNGNAFDLLGDLRRMGCDAPVFMTSAYATDGTKDRARAAGARHFFEKPFDLSAIRKRVVEALQAAPALGATVLLVESHPKVRADLETSAAQAGFTVIAAEDGAKALDILASNGSEVDLLLVDLHAHGSSGARLIRKALDLAPALHVVMMSGEATRDEIRAGYEAGAASLLRKPIPAAQIPGFLKSSLKAARAARERSEERRKRTERLAAEPLARRVARRIKSFLHAPSRSRKGGLVWAMTFGTFALMLGAGTAFFLGTAVDEATRLEAMMERAMRMAPAPAVPSGRQEAALGRLQGAEQLRLMREANEFTRRYYEGSLEEQRRQNLPKRTLEASVMAPDRTLSLDR